MGLISIHAQEREFALMREEMVRKQIIARGVTDQEVLQAMRNVKRHLFVPDKYKELSYRDGPLPIGFGQTISQPYIVGLMTQLLRLDEQSRVLEIGTGSGYQAAILGEICDSVFTIEIVENLGKKAQILLADLKYEKVTVRIGDGYLGWPEKAPFDGIIVTCAPTSIPEPLKEQLAEDGRMVIPVGKHSIKELVVLHKKKGRLVRQYIIPVSFVPMVDEEGLKY
ncbi:MAG: protein-L-isoaspartate(D-aspartate) O-methyltransferase [Marinifilaceae bacterium]